MNTTINFQISIPRILDIWKNKFQLDKQQSIELSSSFYIAFYKYRKKHDCLRSNSITISKKNLKLIIHNCRQYAYNIESISHQKLLSTFFREVSNNENIQLTNLSVALKYRGKTVYVASLTKKIQHVNQDILGMSYNIVSNYTYLKGNSLIPMELACIVAFDVCLTFHENKQYFIKFKNTMSYVMNNCISELILRIGRQIDGDGSYYVPESPYQKKSYFMLRQTNIIRVSYSLPFICDYFGYSAWYSRFFDHDEKKYDDYYKFDLFK